MQGAPHLFLIMEIASLLLDSTNIQYTIPWSWLTAAWNFVEVRNLLG
jgi:hypothetical protein